MIRFFKRSPQIVGSGHFFHIAHLNNDLKTRTIRSGAVTISAQAIKFVISMGSTVILARLLTPEDFGLIGMVTVVIGFVDLLKDLGLAEATVQQEQINQQQISTLFWINFAISCAIALTVALLSPLIAWFYHEPRLLTITLALAITFIFSGLTVQHQALLRRQMNFAVLAKIEMIALVAGIATAQIFAFYGAAYWSLVYMQLAFSLTSVIGTWVACGWRPGLPVWNSDIQSMLKFGGNLTGFRCFNYLSRNFDNFIIGRVWGPGELGFYSKAYQLLLLPINQINGPVYNVVVSTLSRLKQEPDRYCKAYFKATLAIATLGMPLVAFMFVSADKVILLLLGQKWSGVVPIFQFLMPAAFVATFTATLGWAYQSLGEVNRQLRWGFFAFCVNLITFLVGVQWGAIGVAAVYGSVQPFVIAVACVYCYQGTPLKLVNLLKTLSKPAFASLSAAAILFGVDSLFQTNLNVLISLVLDCMVYSLLYLSIWMVIPDGKNTLLEILKDVKDFKQKTSLA